MNFRLKLIRKLGIKSLDGSSTFVNYLAKSVLQRLHIHKGSGVYEKLRTYYRKTGKVKRIERSYSSFGEDRVLAKYLPEIQGTYIDVGAGTPINGSNTYLFYERGWHGITIDPISTLNKKHKKSRPKDNQILAAVSDRNEKRLAFYEYTADDYSTTSQARVDELREMGYEPKGHYLISTITLRSLSHFCNPKMPTFLNIDVEGTELSVLEGNSWDECKPRVVAVEEWKSPIYERSPIRILLEKQGYRLVSRCYLTSIYVHTEYLEKV